jgi:hypothetical protein
MTDVRLTATTPEGEVVPLLANAKGEVLLEEPIAPPKFDGNLDGNLSVGGTGTFAGVITRDSTGDNHAFLVNKDSTQRMRIDSFGGIYIGDTSGDLTGANAKISLAANGSAEFADRITTGTATANAGLLTVTHNVASSGAAMIRGVIGTDTANPTFLIRSNGSADFSGDVVIGSRGKQWLIRESNGVAMLIDQTKRGAKELRIEEEVRDLPRELDLVEAALNEIMGKLKMTPPSGWPVWDGSDESQ